MRLLNKYSKQVFVERLETTGYKQDYNNISSFYGQLQSLNAEDKELIKGDWSKSFVLYADIEADILVGDRVTIASQIYYVRALKQYGVGTLQHLKIIIEEKNA